MFRKGHRDHPHRAGRCDFGPALWREPELLRHLGWSQSLAQQLLPAGMQLAPAARHGNQEPLIAQVVGDLPVHVGPGVSDEVGAAAVHPLAVVAA